MKKISIFIVLIALTIPIHANNYLWLHGLGDNANCWKIYDEALTPGIGIRVGYSSALSIPNIGTDIWGTKYNHDTGSWEYLPSKSNVILIGHSLGGLVAREIEAKGSPNIKGIITIGTPHQGAPIEAQLASGGAKKLFGNVYNKITNSVSGTLSCISAALFPLPVSAGTYAGALGLASFFKDPALDGLMGSMADGSQLSEYDMQPGSTYMNTVASTRKVKVPILCFAAEEDRWALARLGYCAMNKSTLQTDPNLNSDGNYDMKGYDYMQTAVTVSYVMGGVHAAAATAYGALGWWNPYCWYCVGLNGYTSYEWFSTADYLNSGLDYDNGVMVGNCGYEQRSYCYTILVPPSTTPYLEVKPQKIASPDMDDYEEQTICTTKTVAVPVGNDGIVSTYTQLLDKTKGTNVIWANATIKGVNHMEEFNHPKTRVEFDNVINGRSYLPSTFRK